MARTPRAADPFAAIAASLKDFDEELALTLRQLGVRDPLPGAPLRWQIGREPDEVALIEPGKWDEAGFADRRTGLPPGCPVTPLGKSGEAAWFLDTMGAVFALEARSSGKGPIGALFAGRSRYLEWAWPRFGRAPRGGGSGPVVGWEADNARQALFDAAAWKGHFALEDQVRGRGAWKDDDGSLIYHAGDGVWIDGEWRAPGVHGRYIYPGRPIPIGRPSGRPQPAGADGPGEMLFELLKTFNWDRGELDARLMLGWIVTAKVGGALHRRPVCFVTGTEGSGKSTLHEVLRAVMNRALIKTSNTTQAGIYQTLQQDSVAILIDEFEGKEDSRVADKILELARIAYSGDVMQRGGKDGVGKEFQLFSSFMGSAVSKPATDATDDSRMFVAMLREREKAGGKVALSINELDALGRHLLRRIFDWWAPRPGRCGWEGLVELFRQALIAAGHNDRACDTFAPLAAGCHLALSDDEPRPEELAQWGVWLAPDVLTETAGREKTWRRCFNHLLNAQPDVWRNHTEKSVGTMLERYDKEPMFLAGLEERLAQVGLAISWAEGEAFQVYDTARLFVPTNHPGVHALFAGTQWAGRLGSPGPWVPLLRQAPKLAPDGQALWWNGKCGRGLDRKAAGLFIRVKQALEV
jgi:hypothetical protein